MKKILTAAVTAFAIMSFTTAVFASDAPKPIVIADDAAVSTPGNAIKKNEKAMKAEAKAAKEKTEAEAKVAKAKMKAEAKEAKAKVKADKAKAKAEAEAAKEAAPIAK
jgi:Skp family chaperone for outer membrane proteins